MKKIFLVVLLFTSFNFYAQGQSGGERSPQNQNRQGGEQREVKEFNASAAAGIFYYDIKKVIKKIKVKDKNTQNIVKKALKDYNFKIKEIAFLNSEKFMGLNVVMKTLKGANIRQGNRNDNNDDGVGNPVTNKRGGIRGKIQNIIRPVRKEIRGHEERLNETLENVLSEKQNKKWLKYQKKQKDELMPKRPERNQNNNGQRQRSNGQQRRF